MGSRRAASDALVRMSKDRGRLRRERRWTQQGENLSASEESGRCAEGTTGVPCWRCWLPAVQVIRLLRPSVYLRVYIVTCVQRCWRYSDVVLVGLLARFFIS